MSYISFCSLLSVQMPFKHARHTTFNNNLAAAIGFVWYYFFLSKLVRSVLIFWKNYYCHDFGLEQVCILNEELGNLITGGEEMLIPGSEEHLRCFNGVKILSVSNLWLTYTSASAKLHSYLNHSAYLEPISVTLPGKALRDRLYWSLEVRKVTTQILMRGHFKWIWTIWSAFIEKYIYIYIKWVLKKSTKSVI